MPLIFFLVCCLFSGCSCIVRIWDATFSDWPERPCRAVARSVNRTLYARVCHDGCASRSPPYYWFLTLAPARSDLGASFLMPLHYGGCAGRAPILWRLRVDYGVRVGGCQWDFYEGCRWPECRIKFPAHCQCASRVVVVGRSVSLHRHQILEWYSRRRNAHQAMISF